MREEERGRERRRQQIERERKKMIIPAQTE